MGLDAQGAEKGEGAPGGLRHEGRTGHVSRTEGTPVPRPKKEGSSGVYGSSSGLSRKAGLETASRGQCAPNRPGPPHLPNLAACTLPLRPYPSPHCAQAAVHRVCSFQSAPDERPSKNVTCSQSNTIRETPRGMRCKRFLMPTKIGQPTAAKITDFRSFPLEVSPTLGCADLGGWCI